MDNTINKKFCFKSHFKLENVGADRVSKDLELNTFDGSLCTAGLTKTSL